MIEENFEIEELVSQVPESKLDFAMEVELFVEETGSPYIAAVIEIADKHDIDVTKVNQYIGPTIKEKMRIEGEASGLLLRTSRPAVRFE